MMLRGQLELASLDLAEAGLVALLLHLPQDGAVDRRVRRLAFGLPVTRLEGALDDGLARQRLTGLGKHLCRCVQTARFLGLLCALVVGVHSRRGFVPVWQTVLWCVIAVTCGLAVLLTYFTTESRPKLEHCSACGRKKPLSALRCPRCRAEVPPPAGKATDIFA